MKARKGRAELFFEALEEQPRWLRWPLRALHSIYTLGRVIVALQAVGGAIGIVVGAVTLEGKLVLMGFGQLILAGLVLGIDLGSEHVTETSGPQGAFVIRTNKRRVWREARGLQKLRTFVTGDRVWAIVVRRRADDPFGSAMLTQTAPTEREALPLAKQLERQIRQGDDL